MSGRGKVERASGKNHGACQNKKLPLILFVRERLESYKKGGSELIVTGRKLEMRKHCRIPEGESYVYGTWFLTHVFLVGLPL